MLHMRWNRLAFMLAALLWCLAAMRPAVADVSASQKRAAEEYLAAVAAGDARQMALAIYEPELELLRKSLLDALRLEADRNESLLRGRLFGGGMPLSDIERMTAQSFFVTLAARLRFGGRPFERIEWLDAVKDDGSMVHLVGRGRPLKEQGSVRVPVLVTLVPWGKDWKAALPLELQAQIDDLRSGRRAGAAVVAPSAVAPSVVGAGAGAGLGGGVAMPRVQTSPQPVLDLLTTAENNLKAARCEEYYEEQMSPNFRRTIAAKARRTLITSCESRPEIRERLIAALQFAREGEPRSEYAGTRLVYDLRDKGLPFRQFVVEQVDKRWYIAE
jgi:hypothetical protein